MIKFLSVARVALGVLLLVLVTYIGIVPAAMTVYYKRSVGTHKETGVQMIVDHVGFTCDSGLWCFVGTWQHPIARTLIPIKGGRLTYIDIPGNFDGCAYLSTLTFDQPLKELSPMIIDFRADLIPHDDEPELDEAAQ